MLDYNDDPAGKFMYDLQEVGLMVNEMKNKGENSVPIETYENVLEALITVTDNYRELDLLYEELKNERLSFIKQIREALGVRIKTN